jgi:hypothetical protein
VTSPLRMATNKGGSILERVSPQSTGGFDALLPWPYAALMPAEAGGASPLTASVVGPAGRLVYN